MDIHFKINKFLVNNWLKDFEKNKLKGSYEFNIDEKIVRKILKYKEVDYKISLKTVKNICDAKGVKLSEFFKLIGE